MSERRNNPRPVDRFAGLNDPADAFKNPTQLLFVRSLIDILRQFISGAISKDEAASHFHLVSPSGKTYKVTVADDGTLSSTYVQG